MLATMVTPRNIRYSLERWKTASIGKYSKPEYKRKTSSTASSTGEPLSMSDGIDCTYLGPQTVPSGYNPQDVEITQSGDSTSTQSNSEPGITNGETENTNTPTILHNEPDTMEPAIISGPPAILAGPPDDGMSICSLTTWDTTTSWADAMFRTISEAQDLSNISDETIPQWKESVFSQGQWLIDPEPPEADSDLGSLAVLERAQAEIEQAAAHKMACSVCWELKDPSEFPPHPPSSSCHHCIAECCTSCLTFSIDNSLQTRYWNDIRCPSCDEHIGYEGMKEFASPEAFMEYDKRALTHYLSSVPNFRYCTSPTCNFGQIHVATKLGSDTLPPRIACSMCSVISCSRHNVPWHEGETCEEFDARLAIQNKEQDKGSKKEVKRITKACPKKNCGLRIDKNGGCQHMTCLCGHEFCWDCLKDYPGHTWICPSRRPRRCVRYVGNAFLRMRPGRQRQRRNTRRNRRHRRNDDTDDD